MATWSHQVITQRIARWVIPAGPLGACWNEIEQVMHAARARYRAEYEVPECAAVPDDAVRVRPWDDAIIVDVQLPDSNEKKG